MIEKELNGDKMSLSVPIVEAVSENTNGKAADFILYDNIEIDALDSLFRREEVDGTLRIVFDVLDQTVVVERVGETVTIRVATAGTEVATRSAF